MGTGSSAAGHVSTGPPTVAILSNFKCYLRLDPISVLLDFNTSPTVDMVRLREVCSQGRYAGYTSMNTF